MHLLISEGKSAATLMPLNDLRPSFDLKLGARSLFDRIAKNYEEMTISLGVRGYLKDVAQEIHPNYSVNSLPTGPALIIDGMTVWTTDLAKIIRADGPDTLFISNGDIIAARLANFVSSLVDIADPLSGLDQSIARQEVEAKTIRRPWDLISLHPELLGHDLSNYPDLGHHEGHINETAHMISAESIAISSSATVGAAAVLDATAGPIVIGDNAVIGHHVVIRGPVFIGEHSIINDGARISRSTYIGERCKIGGEVVGTIFHGYSNKQHDGFLGKSYVGNWVNLGAATNNSDLKNDYGHVKFVVEDESIDSRQQSLGCIIGDHVKFGIGSTINTGAIIGTGSNLFGTTLIQKTVPQFSWGEMGHLNPYRFDKFIDVARTVMARRDQILSASAASVLGHIYGIK